MNVGVDLEHKRAADLGLTCGQKRTGDGVFYFGADWYHADGKLIGWGDLSVDDVQRMKLRLDSHEAIVIVSSGRAACGTRPNSQSLLSTAAYIICRDDLYFVTPFKDENVKTLIERAGLRFHVLSPVEARQTIAQISNL